MKQPILTPFLGYARNWIQLKLCGFLEMNLQNLVNCGLQGVANRGCSIRVGRETEKQGKGM